MSIVVLTVSAPIYRDFNTPFGGALRGRDDSELRAGEDFHVLSFGTATGPCARVHS